jgi:hypothetical protein
VRTSRPPSQRLERLADRSELHAVLRCAIRAAGDLTDCPRLFDQRRPTATSANPVRIATPPTRSFPTAVKPFLSYASAGLGRRISPNGRGPTRGLHSSRRLPGGSFVDSIRVAPMARALS